MSRYYESWEPGTFPHQRALCEALAATPYALDDDPFNPLTLRLVAALEATNRLAQTLERPIPTAAPSTVDLEQAEAGEPTLAWVADRPMLLTFEVRTGRDGDFPVTEAQSCLFQFIHAYTGALDRVGREISLLLDGDGRRPGWRSAAQPRTLRRWRGRHPALTAWLSGPTAAPLLRAFDYLAWFQEAGFLPTNAEPADNGRRWRLWIPEAGPNSSAAMSVDALQLCRVLQRDACTVFNGVYHMLHQQGEQQGPPPW